MKFNVYSLRDVCAKELGPLFSAKNDDTAIRMVCESFTFKHIKDLELCCLGSFNTEKGLHGSFVRVVNFDKKECSDRYYQEYLFPDPIRGKTSENNV